LNIIDLRYQHAFKEVLLNSLLRSLLSLIIITSLSACNENSDDPIGAKETIKPQILFTKDEAFAGFIRPPLIGEDVISVIPYPENKIIATDNSGMATLSISKVIGLDLSQVSLNSDRNIEFNNIKHDTAIGVGFITIRATDKSGNYSEQELFFAITAALGIKIKQGESIAVKYPVMSDIDQVEITQPLKSTGISTSAYLANNELFINITANTNAATEENAMAKLTIHSTKSETEIYQEFSIKLIPN